MKKICYKKFKNVKMRKMNDHQEENFQVKRIIYVGVSSRDGIFGLFRHIIFKQNDILKL